MTKIYTYDEDGFLEHGFETEKCPITGEDVRYDNSTTVEPKQVLFGYLNRFNKEKNEWVAGKKVNEENKSSTLIIDYDLDYYKSSAKYESQRAIGKSIKAGYSFDGLVFDIDSEGVANMNTKLSSMEDDDSVIWYSADNKGYEFINKNAFKIFVKEVQKYIENLWLSHAIICNEVDCITDFNIACKYDKLPHDVDLTESKLEPINKTPVEVPPVEIPPGLGPQHPLD